MQALRLSACVAVLVMVCQCQMPDMPDMPDMGSGRMDMGSGMEMGSGEWMDDMEGMMRDMKLTDADMLVLERLKNQTSLSLEKLTPDYIKRVINFLRRAPEEVRRVILSPADADSARKLVYNASRADFPAVLLPLMKQDVLQLIGNQLRADGVLADGVARICNELFEERVSHKISEMIAMQMGNFSCNGAAAIAGRPLDRSPSQSRELLDGLYETYGRNVSNWTYSVVAEQWEAIVEVMTIEDFFAFQKFIPKLMKDELFDPEDFGNRAVKMAAGRQLMNSLPPPKQWDSSQFTEKNIRQNLGSFSDEDWEGMDPSEMIKVDMRDMRKEMTSGQETVFRKQLLKGFRDRSGGFATANGTDIDTMLQFSGGDKSLIGEIGGPRIMENIKHLTPKNMGEGVLINIMGTLKKDGPLANPESMTLNDTRDLKDMMRFAGPGVFRKMKPEVIGGAAKDLRNVSFDGRQMQKLVFRAFMTSMKKSLNNLTSSELHDLGGLITGLPIDDLMNISRSALRKAMANGSIEDADMNKIQARLFAKVMSDDDEMPMERRKRQIEEQGSCPDSDTMNALGSSIEDAFDSAELKNCKDLANKMLDMNDRPKWADMIGRKQAKVLGEMALSDIGGTGGGNFSLDMMENMGNAGTMGLSADSIRNMTDDFGDLADMMEMLGEADKLRQLTNAQTEAGASLVRSKFDFSSAEVSMSAIEASQMGAFMKHLNETELDRIPNDNCHIVFEAISQTNLDSLSEEQLENLTMRSLRNCSVFNTTTGELLDRSKAMELNSDDLTSLGPLKRYIPYNMLKNLTGDALKNHLKDLSEGCLSPKKMRLLKNITMERMPELLNGTYDDLLRAGNVLGYLDSENRSMINKTELGSITTDLAQSVKSRQEACRRRKKAGFIDDKSDDEEEELDEADDNMMEMLTESQAMLNVDEDTVENRRRRRRQAATTPALLCSDIQSIDSTITADQIEVLDPSEFEDCIETLGGMSDWDEEELDALVEQAKTLYGSDVAEWTAEDATAAGSILFGLSEDEFMSLDWSSIDLVQVIGSYGDLAEEEHLSTAFSMYVQQALDGNVDSLTADDLNAMGHVACGAAEEAILEIAPSSYMGAASVIGELDTCSPEQLMQYAKLAATAFGEVSSWTEDDIAAIGVVLGGLTYEQISEIRVDMMQHIPVNALSNIPPETFAKFSQEQLAGLSLPQLHAITGEQQMELSDDLRDFIIDLGAPDKAAACIYGINMMLLLVMVFFSKIL